MGVLERAGYAVSTELVPDGVAPIQAALQRALDGGARVVLTTGGTGLTPTDHTPEAVLPMLDRVIPGIAEEIRRQGVQQTPAALLSRAVAGTIGPAFVLTMPGSPRAVTSALAVVMPLLEHILSQVEGGDHG